jgi:Na+-transporting NADH:ubiquinone oxidoreductase subunit NqrE
MKGIIAAFIKSIFTESILKQIFLVVGDFLVASSKNKLDDKIWDSVKKKFS